jgi:hypothetical protein
MSTLTEVQTSGELIIDYSCNSCDEDDSYCGVVSVTNGELVHSHYCYECYNNKIKNNKNYKNEQNTIHR